MKRIVVPERLTQKDLDTLVAELRGADGVRMLVGAGAAFCRGMDLSATGGDPEPAFGAFTEALAAIRTAPTVAFVDGDAHGGGCGLAAACDLVLATPKATFALPELLLGLVPGAILPALLDRMPAQKVRRLAMTGLSMKAEEAHAMGLVDAIVADEAEAKRHAKTLGRADPAAVAALRALMDVGFDAAVAKGARATRARLADPETKRRIAVFLDGGAPWSA